MHMSEKPWRDEQRLRELYWDKEMTHSEIADKLGCSRTTIQNWFDKFDIPTRSKSERCRKAKEGNEPWHDEETLRQLYWDEKMSMQEIADHFDASYNAIFKWMDRHDIKRRDSVDATKLKRGVGTVGVRHYWREDGYECVRVDNVGSCNNVFIHRLTAVSEYGFDEVRDNVVHHINSVKWDNRPSNLKPMSVSDHSSLHRNERGDDYEQAEIEVW